LEPGGVGPGDVRWRSSAELELDGTAGRAVQGADGDMGGAVAPASARRARAPIAVRRAERELFFWTARQTLKLVVLVALTVYLLVSLLEGRLPGGELLARYL